MLDKAINLFALLFVVVLGLRIVQYTVNTIRYKRMIKEFKQGITPKDNLPM
jgi:hypothetical protein